MYKVSLYIVQSYVFVSFVHCFVSVRQCKHNRGPVLELSQNTQLLQSCSTIRKSLKSLLFYNGVKGKQLLADLRKFPPKHFTSISQVFRNNQVYQKKGYKEYLRHVLKSYDSFHLPSQIVILYLHKPFRFRLRMSATM